MYPQELINSPVYVQTCINNTQCFSVINDAYLFYDEQREELFLRVDFKKVKAEKDSLYYWLDDLSGSDFLFKAKISRLQFPLINSSHIKVLKLNGWMYFNSVLQHTVVELSILGASEGSLPQITSNQNVYPLYRISFGLSFLPKDFKIHNKPHHLKKTISIGVTAGKINLLLPGMHHWVKEIYDK
jgi:hypothetical protein